MLWDAWLVQSVEYITLDLGVVSLIPKLGIEFTYKKKTLKNKMCFKYLRVISIGQ